MVDGSFLHIFFCFNLSYFNIFDGFVIYNFKFSDLLGQFTSHRVTALRSAAQKHDKALKTAQAAMHVDDQSDASRLSKRDENRQIYNQSKPHYSSR